MNNARAIRAHIGDVSLMDNDQCGVISLCGEWMKAQVCKFDSGWQDNAFCVRMLRS
jgi:hypothetical protein